MRFLAIALCLLLAGCTNSPSTDAATDEPEAAAPVTEVLENGTEELATFSMDQRGCNSFYSFHDVPASFAEPYMPEGFTPVAFMDGVYYAVKTWRCPDGDGSTGGKAALHYLGVEPPAELAVDGAVFHWLLLDLVAEGPVKDGFQALGLAPFEMGSNTYDHFWLKPAERWNVVVASQPVTFEHEAYITEQAAADAFVVGYFSGDGATRVAITVHPHSAGTGVGLLTVEGQNSPFAEEQQGEARHQTWLDGALSYTWTAV